MKKFAFISLIPLALQLPASAALTDNLVAYYNFEESGSPGLANKAPGASTHNGVFLGTPSNGADSGFAGNAVFAGTNFDGGPDTTTNRSTLLVGNALNVIKGTATATNGGQFTVGTLTSRGPGVGGDFGTLGTQFSVSAWFYLAPDADNSSVTNSRRDFVFESVLDGTTSTQVYDISWGTTGDDTTIYSPYVGQNQITAGNADLAAGAWQHVVHTFTTSGADTRMDVYVNGSFVASGTALTTNVDFRGINFGANRAGNARVFDGMIDEVAVWNRALSASEAAELFARGNSGISVTASALVVNLTASPATSGTVSGSGLYTGNPTIQVTATANPGYDFSEWLGDFAGKPASFSQTISASATSTAVFIQDTRDTDGDGLSNYDEISIYQTLHDNPDTDGDGIPDGAEVNITETSPTTSDASLVTFVQNNLSTGAQAGAIALSPVRVTRDPVTSALSLSVNVEASADQKTWQTIDLGPGSIVPSGNGWNLTIPAPSNSVNSYILRGSRN